MRVLFVAFSSHYLCPIPDHASMLSSENSKEGRWKRKKESWCIWKCVVCLRNWKDLKRVHHQLQLFKVVHMVLNQKVKSIKVPGLPTLSDPRAIKKLPMMPKHNPNHGLNWMEVQGKMKSTTSILAHFLKLNFCTDFLFFFFYPSGCKKKRTKRGEVKNNSNFTLVPGNCPCSGNSPLVFFSMYFFYIYIWVIYISELSGLANNIIIWSNTGHQMSMKAGTNTERPSKILDSHQDHSKRLQNRLSLEADLKERRYEKFFYICINVYVGDGSAFLP